MSDSMVPTERRSTVDTGEPNSSRGNVASSVVGSLLLAVGAIIVCLAFADGSGGVSIWLPRSWYTNRPLWYLIAMVSFGGAWTLLHRSSTAEGESVSRPRFTKLVLYTRAGCHLCDEMKATLERYQQYFPAIEEVDIDRDPALVARFTECVPVLEIDGRVRFRGRLNEVLLRRIIDATPSGGRPVPPSEASAFDRDEDV
jgi:glutaredoxin